MTIYIAAKFAKRKELRDITELLNREGIQVTSSWIFDDDKDFHEIDTVDELITIGCRDIYQIMAAEVVVIDTIDELSKGGGGGREFEAGVGYGVHNIFWRVGPARSPFHLIATRSWETWEEFIKWVQNQA